MKARRPIAQHLDSPTDEARISRMWRVVGDRRAGTPSPRRRWAAAAMAAGAALAWALWPTPPPPEATSRDPFVVPETFEGTAGEARFELGDGSRIEVSSGSTLRTIESSGERFVTLLERGRARRGRAAPQNVLSLRTEFPALGVHWN